LKKVLLVILFCLFSLPSFADEGKGSAYDRVIRTNTLRCGVMLWPPYFEKDANTAVMSGFGVDFYNAVAQILDVKIEYVEIIVGQQAEDLNRGKIDAVCNDGPYVFSAMKFVDYSMPAYFGPIYIFVREDNQVISSIGDLNNESVRFIGMDGDISADLVERRFPKASLSTLPATSDAASLMMQVITGKADAVYIDKPPVDGFNAMNSPKLKMINEARPVVYPVGMSVKKGEQELLNMLNSGIAALWNSGGALPIIQKYDPDLKMILPLAKPYEMGH
jgi:ABC-type amino acid transport substrate-binding protein